MNFFKILIETNCFAQQFPDTKPADYDFQFNLVKQKEKDLVEADIAKENSTEDPADGQNGSAIKITEGADGTSDFVIGIKPITTLLCEIAYNMF